MTRKPWAALAVAASLLQATGCSMFGDSNSSSGGGSGFFSRMSRNGGGCFGGACGGGDGVVEGGPVGYGMGGCPTCCGSTPGAMESPTMVTPSLPILTPAPMPGLPTAPPPRIAPIPQAAPVPYSP